MEGRRRKSFGGHWRTVVSTAADTTKPAVEVGAAATFTVDARATVVLQAVPADEAG